MNVLLAQPRGVCAGVERAIKSVRLALARFGAPVHVRKEIVHNRHVVEGLQEEGAVFVEDLHEIPIGARVIFSAHGVSPRVREEAQKRSLRPIDATCPLVARVHQRVARAAQRGEHVVLIGNEGHDEAIGTMGHAPQSVTLVSDEADAMRVSVPAERGITVLTQTTLSTDDTAGIFAALRRRFPAISQRATTDICYATQNRQNAVKKIADRVQLLLVVGSTNSSNATRLLEVGVARGLKGHLIEDERALDPLWLAGVDTVGVTSGASTPETLVNRVLDRLSGLGANGVDICASAEEQVTFALPPELYEAVTTEKELSP